MIARKTLTPLLLGAAIAVYVGGELGSAEARPAGSPTSRAHVCASRAYQPPVLKGHFFQAAGDTWFRPKVKLPSVGTNLIGCDSYGIRVVRYFLQEKYTPFGGRRWVRGSPGAHLIKTNYQAIEGHPLASLFQCASNRGSNALGRLAVRIAWRGKGSQGYRRYHGKTEKVC